jgi:hypothetical protein
VLLSSSEGVSDEEVLAAAEALGTELATLEESVSESTFDTVATECVEAISDESGIDYEEVCDTGGCC